MCGVVCVSAFLEENRKQKVNEKMKYHLDNLIYQEYILDRRSFCKDGHLFGASVSKN